MVGDVPKNPQNHEIDVSGFESVEIGSDQRPVKQNNIIPIWEKLIFDIFSRSATTNAKLFFQYVSYRAPIEALWSLG